MKHLATLFLTSVFIITCSQAIAQKDKKAKGDAQPVATPTTATTPAKTNADGFDLHINVFHQALRYADFSTAAIALNYAIALKPDAKEYKDTLAFVYSELGASVQALSVAKEILTTNPNSASILEVAAGSEENLNLLKESVEDYEKLFKISNKPYHLYKIAGLQYYLKRFGECTASINSLLNNPAIKDEKVSLNYDRQQRQEVPMSAALYNIRGMVNIELNDYKAARENFDEALKIQPDFQLAKGNIGLLDKYEAEKDKPQTPPTKTTPKTGGK